MLGISFDSVEANKAFADRYEYPFKLLSDATRHAGVAFGVADTLVDAHAKRCTFLIDAEGLVREAIDTKHPAAQAEALLRII